MILAYQTNLSGSETIELIRKGHIASRACWINDYFIRICNEIGFNDDGNAYGAGHVPLLLLGTDGYFFHIGTSAQPFNYRHHAKEGEGIALLFADDWIDHGFISAADFKALIDSNKAEVRERIKVMRIER